MTVVFGYDRFPGSFPGYVSTEEIESERKRESEISSEEMQPSLKLRAPICLSRAPSLGSSRPGNSRVLIIPKAVWHVAESWILFGSAAVSLSIPVIGSRLRGRLWVNHGMSHPQGLAVLRALYWLKANQYFISSHDINLYGM